MITELSKNGERWNRDREIKRKKVLDKKTADVIIYYGCRKKRRAGLKRAWKIKEKSS